MIPSKIPVSGMVDTLPKNGNVPFGFMVYNKQSTLRFLRNPYRGGSRKKKTKRMRTLRGRITAMNNRTKGKRDFIQNKYRFRLKIKDVVKVPEIYYCGKDMKCLRDKMSSLDEFVMKPNHLSRGIGIRVLKRDGEKFVDLNGDILTIQDLLDECDVLIHKRRYGTPQVMIIEQAIHSHPSFNCYGMADIRMIYYRNSFVFSVARIPSKKSRGYGNIIRGADWGVVIGGRYMIDRRFQETTIQHGILPFFVEMVLAGQKVTKLYGTIFQAIDMTVDETGTPVIIEAERLPQIEYYLTDKGVQWLSNIMKKDMRRRGRTKKRTTINKGMSKYFPPNTRKVSNLR